MLRTATTTARLVSAGFSGRSGDASRVTWPRCRRGSGAKPLATSAVIGEHVARSPANTPDMTAQGDSSQGKEDTKDDFKNRPKIIYVPRKALAQDPSRSGARELTARNRFFTVKLVPLSPMLRQAIDAGPPFLKANYPPGVLEGRHERRRVYIDGAPSGWRSVDVLEPNGNVSDESLRPLPSRSFLGERLQPHMVPVVVMTSKKQIDKRAVVRNKVRTHIVEGLRGVMYSSKERACDIVNLVNPQAEVPSVLPSWSSMIPLTPPAFYLMIFATESAILPRSARKGAAQVGQDTAITRTEKESTTALWEKAIDSLMLARARQPRQGGQKGDKGQRGKGGAQFRRNDAFSM